VPEAVQAAPEVTDVAAAVPEVDVTEPTDAAEPAEAPAAEADADQPAEAPAAPQPQDAEPKQEKKGFLKRLFGR
jgi:hypothetical protein